MSIFLMKLKFFKIRLTAAENRMSNLSSLISEQIALAAVFYFGQVFFFLRVNQQNPVGMVSTNNITYSEQIYKPF